MSLSWTYGKGYRERVYGKSRLLHFVRNDRYMDTMSSRLKRSNLYDLRLHRLSKELSVHALRGYLLPFPLVLNH